ncbi:MAG: carotenoid oxygenase family protein [Sphingomonadaceae bacterium]
MSQSPWVKGPYTPVNDELDVCDLPMTGRLPPELNGILARIGPSPIGEVGADHNLFFGDGMVHAVTFENGVAKAFRNRWVRTEPVARKLGESNQWPALAGEDVANTHIIPFAGKYYAMTETCIPYRLDAAFATEARDDFNGFIDRGFTAHPHIDPNTGNLHAIGYAVDAQPEVTHYVFDPHGAPLRRTRIAMNGPAWVHDFAMTASYLILWDLPLQFDQACADAGEQAPYKWQPNYHASVGLRPIDGTDDSVIWFDAPAAFVFHPVNAWEEPNAEGEVVKVVCDVSRYAKMFDQVRTGPGDMAPPQLYRWEFDLRNRTMTEALLDPRVQEFPRIDDRFWGKRHGFSVMTELFRFSGGSGLITRYGDGSSQEHSFGPGNVTSEGIFIPHGEDAREGEGLIMALVSEAKSGATKVAVFEAEQLAKGPMAEITLPQRVPYTFHGSWMPALG